MSLSTEQETFSFRAEVVQLLDLMINSLYSNKDIFLRELISNASDAIDRLRLERLVREDLPDDDGPLQILVSYDAGARTITVSDNGIGMSRQEAIDNLGTIARSGTREFLAAMARDQRKKTNLIGVFGVGFYSAFIVAERVTVTTWRAGLAADEGVRWESDAMGEFTVQPGERESSGTTVELLLREGEEELLNHWRLRSIIARYSDHISVPILMPAEPGDDPAAAGNEQSRGPAGDSAQDPDDDAPRYTTVNRASALWTRPKKEISKHEYYDFYRHVASDYADPLAYVHSKIEGRYEYTFLLFIPSHAPYDLWQVEQRNTVRLHVRRVFIMEDDGQLMPRYLRFVRGIIDSADLPLNVSRELLQRSRVVDAIRSHAVRVVLRLLRDIADNQPANYATLWRHFGPVLKEGIAEDYSNREALAQLLRFRSTVSAGSDPDVSLAQYVARMSGGQDKIFYLLATTPDLAASSPHLEVFRQKDIEVLLLGDDIDTWVLNTLQEFDGIRLQSVADGDPGVGAQDEDEQAARERATADHAVLVARMRDLLDGKVRDVRVSSRLTTSAACVVGDGPDLGAPLGGAAMPRQPVLEINPEHPLVSRLNRDPDDPRLRDWARLLYDQSVLMLSARVEDPALFVSRLNELLVALVEPGDPQSAE
jgi:molecular chaperone HtpG